jgi:hypothetical protein
MSIPLPPMRMSPPFSFFSARTFSTTSSLMIVAFQVADCRVREATYLGMLFIFSPNSPVPSIFGQAAAKPS